MSRPKAGDTVRVPYYICGHFAGFREFELCEYNYCLGFYEEDGPRCPQNFTPLSELYEPSPDAEQRYWSNYGTYHSDYIQTFDVISK